MLLLNSKCLFTFSPTLDYDRESSWNLRLDRRFSWKLYGYHDYFEVDGSSDAFGRLSLPCNRIGLEYIFNRVTEHIYIIQY